VEHVGIVKPLRGVYKKAKLSLTMLPQAARGLFKSTKCLCIIVVARAKSRHVA